MPSLPIVYRVISDRNSVLVNRRKKREVQESKSKGQPEEVIPEELSEPQTDTKESVTSEEPKKIGKAIAKEVMKHKSSSKHHTSTTEMPPITTTTESLFRELEDDFKAVKNKTHMPASAVFLILLLIMTIIGALFYFCISKWWKKFKDSDHKGFKGIFSWVSKMLFRITIARFLMLFKLILPTNRFLLLI